MDRLSRIYIPKRLYSRLKCIYSERLTVISAPEGCGKSVTVREFVRRSRPLGGSCRIITDCATDNECFKEYCRIVLGREEQIPVTQEEFMRMCRIFSAVRLPVSTAVIFDTPAAAKMILRNMYCAKLFYLHAPARTTVICGEPSDVQKQMISEHRINNITEEELRLTDEETAEYFGLCGVEGANTEHIRSMTGGEIFRIRLAATALARGITVTDYSSGSLINAIMESLPLSVRFAGLAAASFIRLDEHLFRDLSESPALTEYFGAQALSEAAVFGGIDTVNRVVHMIDINKKTKRHSAHILFRRAMYGMFVGLPDEVRRAFHRCSALDYLRLKMTFRSFCQFYLSGDYNAAASVGVREPVSFEMLLKNKELIYGFVTECPLDCKPIIPRFARLLSILMITEYKDRVRHRYNELTEHISASPDYTEGERRNMLSYIYALRTYEAYYRLDKMGTHIKRAYDLFSGTSASYPPIYSWSLYAPSVFCLIHRYSLSITTEAEQFSRYHRMYTEMIRHGLYAESTYLAELHFYMGDLHKGLQLAVETIRRCTDDSLLPTRIVSLNIACRCALLMGSYEQLVRFSGELAQIRRLNAGTDVGEMAALCQALLCCMKRGRTEDIWPVASTPDAEVLLNRYTAPFYFFTRSISMLLHGEHRILLDKKEYYMQAARAVENETVLLMLMLAAAAAHLAENETKQAAQLVKEVLDTLGGSGIIMPAVEMCIQFPKLFIFAAEALPARYGPMISKIIAFAKPLRKNMEAVRTQELTEIGSRSKSSQAVSRSMDTCVQSMEKTRKELGLTERALKYALLAARRYSNAEIAEICRTSEDSVKSSLKRTFARLGIRSRGQLRHIFPYKE